MNFIKSIAFTLFFIASLTAISQKDFEGMITYSIEYVQLPQELKGFESMLPSEMTSYVKGGKMRTEQETAMTGKQIVIIDEEAKKAVTLMDIMGNKIAMPVPIDEMDDDSKNNSKVKIDYQNDSKTIAGYSCKKAVISSEDSNVPVTVYYTTDFTTKDSNFHDLKGFPLEYTLSEEGMQMRISAKVVEKKTIADSYFETPADYKITSQEELQKMFGGM